MGSGKFAGNLYPVKNGASAFSDDAEKICNNFFLLLLMNGAL